MLPERCCADDLYSCYFRNLCVVVGRGGWGWREEGEETKLGGVNVTNKIAKGGRED